MEFNQIDLSKGQMSRLHEFARFISIVPDAEQILIEAAYALDTKTVNGTPVHAERVALYAHFFGMELDLPSSELEVLHKASLLHDIGKIIVPREILSKETALSPNEQEFMKLHPETGVFIVEHVSSLYAILPVVKYHHERFNGSGYPQGLRGTDIPLYARIVGLVDCFDALTAARSYRQALTIKDALQIMERETEEGLWDPELFVRFVGMIEKNLLKFYAANAKGAVDLIKMRKHLRG